MSDSPAPPPPSDAEVEAALDRVDAWYGAHDTAHTLRTHIAALRSQNAALTAERDALAARVGKVSDRALRFTLPQVQEAETRARVGALRWAIRPRCKEPGSERWTAMIQAEIARIESLLAGEGEEPKRD